MLADDENLAKDGKKYLADPPVDYNLNMEKAKNSHHECVDHFPNRKRMSFRGITNCYRLFIYVYIYIIYNIIYIYNQSANCDLAILFDAFLSLWNMLAETGSSCFGAPE